MTRLWFDDVRTPPDKSWTWARTVDKAKEVLSEGGVVECSLDHDMGLDALDVEAGEHEDWDLVIEVAHASGAHEHAETGLDLVEWMIENERVPEKIAIHSWNPPAAMAMAQKLADHGHECVVAPFTPPPKGRP